MKLLARRMMRRFRYYSSKWWLQRFRYPRDILHLSVLDTLPGKTHNGFYIGVYRREYDTPEFQYFVATIIGSLDLIARHDPRRYKTIARNIKIIAWNPRSSSFGAYSRLFRICTINYREASKERADSADTADDVFEPSLHEVAYLACILVHEATHGRINSFLFRMISGTAKPLRSYVSRKKNAS